MTSQYLSVYPAWEIEHFHRFAKVHLGLAHARLISAEAADRWNAPVVAAYAQLRAAAAPGGR
jgi:hypothetical protein